MGVYRAAGAVVGTITPHLQALVARDLDGRIDELLTQALERWDASGWHRYSSDEVNCSIQLYRHAVDAKRSTRALRSLDVDFEACVPTPAMLAGTESVKSAKRPDLKVRIGEASRHIECKLLESTGPLPRKYVREGMMRFIGGRYGADDPTGRMVGYIAASPIADSASAVNDRINKVASLSPADHLQAADQPHPRVHRFRSSHARVGSPAIGLTHYLALI